MKHSFAALCWGVIALGLAISCAKKSTPPGPSPEKDYGSGQSAPADAGRGRTTQEMGFDK